VASVVNNVDDKKLDNTLLSADWCQVHRPAQLLGLILFF